LFISSPLPLPLPSLSPSQDIDQLVQTFISAEDQNFSLFNYANDLSSQIEKMEESIFTTNQEIKQYQGDGQQGDYQRKRVIEDLEHKLIQTETRAGVYEERQDMAAQTTEALKEGIQALFDKLGAGGDAKIQDMLGTSGVTDSNMMQYLGNGPTQLIIQFVSHKTPSPLLFSEI
jgi:chaperonin cofactor prefoldin